MNNINVPFDILRNIVNELNENNVVKLDYYEEYLSVA